MLQPLEGGQGTRCWESEVEKGYGNSSEAFAFVSARVHVQEQQTSLAVCWENR